MAQVLDCKAVAQAIKEDCRAQSDALRAKGQYAEARQELAAMLDGAASNKDKASILGQMSMVSMLLGEEQADKMEKLFRKRAESTYHKIIELLNEE